MKLNNLLQTAYDQPHTNLGNPSMSQLELDAIHLGQTLRAHDCPRPSLQKFPYCSVWCLGNGLHAVIVGVTKDGLDVYLHGEGKSPRRLLPAHMVAA